MIQNKVYIQGFVADAEKKIVARQHLKLLLFNGFRVSVFQNAESSGDGLVVMVGYTL